MLKLPDVTLWTIVWNEDEKWISRAGAVLRYCLHMMEPARCLLFASREIKARQYPFEIIQIPQLNWQSYNLFINRVVPTYIKSKFALSVHEDGFPLDANLWRPEFLSFDYIGAPWSDGVVGNGGFNIESRKLMDLKCAMPLGADDFTLPSDRLICSARRGYLEERGVRFAPAGLALQFSTEQTGQDLPSFGFHGRGVSRRKYEQGWRQIGAMKTFLGGFWMEGNKVVPPPEEPRVPPYVATPTSNVKAAAPKVELVYVHVVGGGPYMNWAQRFVSSYIAQPPGYDHSTTIVCNGGSPNRESERLFSALPDKKFIVHDNTGWDIGGYIAAAKRSKADTLVCFGASTYFFRPDWLSRMVQAWRKHGPGLYGAHSSYEVTAHLNTIGFWCPPECLANYAYPVVTKEDRYNFEHGRANRSQNIMLPDTQTNRTFWRSVYRTGRPVLFVTWDGEWNWWEWRTPPNILRRGTQANLLHWWRHTDEFAGHDAATRAHFSRSTDNLTDEDFNLNLRRFW